MVERWLLRSAAGTHMDCLEITRSYCRKTANLPTVRDLARVGVSLRGVGTLQPGYFEGFQGHAGGILFFPSRRAVGHVRGLRGMPGETQLCKERQRLIET